MDQLILDAFIGLRVTWLSPVIILFTQLTGPTLMFVYALVWGLLRKSATAPIAVGLANLISHFLKRAFERPRPNTAEHLVVETNFSFPSSHAVGAAACAVAMGYSVNRWWKLTLWVIALLVGLSRLYVGVHWPSDVLAGWAIGALTSVVVFTSWNLLQRR
ncbi:phospholipid phosphatase [Corynebacterium glutamicum]|uniref:phosphatase PAP2 family protein n=1 Tax=Corynebacterium glutamicum TaxID=1718 RepID=UPI0004F61270|nr:phosphatase PAP2 family protein [Corynebacterium glutamicum]AIK86281.1 phospholipid phosphatase [Corynebacterium glutamicum]AIK89064.1 phospholipid phosphatase [Corynebacterium glutamicum]